MIVPSPRTQSELNKDITEPLFLITIGLTVPVYLSTRGPTTYLGQVYEKSQVEVSSIEAGDGGEARCTVRVSPANLNTVLAGIIDTPLNVQELWGREPFSSGDAIPVFDGVIHGSSIHLDWIDLHGAQSNTQGVPSPNIYYDHQNLMPVGTRFAIKGYKVTLEQAEFLND